MTEQQQKQFVAMHQALKTIANDYQTPSEMRDDSEEEYGLEYEEALEMAYENIQQLAKSTLKLIES